MRSCLIDSSRQLRLEGAEVGAFVIRASEKGYAALSVITATGPLHTHIEKDEYGRACKYTYIQRSACSS